MIYDYVDNIADSIEFLIAFCSVISFVMVVVGLFGYFFIGGKARMQFLYVLIAEIIVLAITGPTYGLHYFKVRI